MLRAARAAFPGHRIVYLTTGPTMLETGLRPLLDGIVDDFISETGIGRSLTEFLRPMPVRQRFAVFIDTQPVIWRTLLLRRLRHDLFVTGAARYRLSDRRPADRRRRRPTGIVRRLVELVELASGRPADLATALPVPPEIAAKAAAQLPTGKPLIGLAPGAGNRLKCWPLERYLALARRLVQQGMSPVFLIGPAESEWLPEISAAVPEALLPLQDRALWGERFEVLHTVALGQRLAAAVSNDSGTTHMLAAADVPLVTLFGPSNADKFRPLVSRGAVVKAQDFGGEAMALIPLDAVHAALNTLIGTPV
ncbi:MAG: lipopolysaccharide heptosyltransferase family protein [Azospirillum sp.]|nr:lipopolysaccharide heptosyltransferase family protein [Azospirillum sp.]